MYTEKITLPKWLHVVVVINSIFCISIVLGVQLFGSSAPIDAGVVIGLAAAVLAPFLLLMMIPTLHIDESSVHIRTFPFTKGRIIPVAAIQSWQVRKVSALGEFGGWGLRFLPWSTKIGYIGLGTEGLDIATTAGKQIVVTTRYPDEVRQSMVRLSPGTQVL